MRRLIFQSGELRRLRKLLLDEAPLEAAALLLGGYGRSHSDLRLMVREIITIPSDRYLVREEARLSVSPKVLATVFKRARLEGWTVVLAHSHPFSDQPTFSVADDEGEAIITPSMFERAPGRPHAWIVLGRTGSEARVRTDPLHPAIPIDSIQEVGPTTTIEGSARLQLSAGSLAEHDRSVRALGEESIAVLRRLRVGIVGVGGIGSIVAEQLAYLGVGHLALMDDDRLEETNLNRVVGTTRADVGKPKVQVIASHVTRVRPEIDVQSYPESVLQRASAKRLLDCDLAFCCTDSQGSRAVLNQLAYQYLVPVIDLGVRIDVVDRRVTRITGRAQLLAPGLACLTCHKTLDSEEVRRDLMTEEERKRDPYVVGIAIPQPAVISLNGTVASLGVTMMLAAVTGFPSAARYQVFQGERGVVRAVVATPVAGCVTCSYRGALARGDLWSMPWRLD